MTEKIILAKQTATATDPKARVKNRRVPNAIWSWYNRALVPGVKHEPAWTNRRRNKCTIRKPMTIGGKGTESYVHQTACACALVIIVGQPGNVHHCRRSM